MATYLAFLRAINLGAKRKFPQADVVKAVGAAGGVGVETYLNTGNVRLDSALASTADVEAALEEAFLADRGFEVPTIVMPPDELVAITRDAERLAAGHEGRHYVSLLKQEPTANALAAFEAAVAPLAERGEVAHVAGRGVHLLLGAGYHSAKLSNALVERHLGVATNRNLTVIRTVANRWGG